MVEIEVLNSYALMHVPRKDGLMIKAKIDEVDIERIKRIEFVGDTFEWRAYKDGKQGYSVCLYLDGDPLVTLSHFIMHPPIGGTVRHINGDKLDNRRVNLEIPGVGAFKPMNWIKMNRDKEEKKSTAE